MDPAGFCAQTRVLIVAGKGGVGKTTVSATIARMAADAGVDVLLVEVEGKSGLGAAFGRPEPLTYREVELAPRIRARTLTPDEALVDYLRDHGMKRLSKRLMQSGAIDVVATAVPGIKDILVLGKVKALDRDRVADLIVLDAPAAGHAITFLSAARALLDAVRVGPIRTQAEEVSAFLTDDARCQVVLVALPEETPVNELVETAYALEDRAGISLGPVVVNGLYPPVEGLAEGAALAASSAGVHLRPGEAEALDAAARFRLGRQALQAEQVTRLNELLPLPQVRLPFVFATEIGPPELDELANAMAAEVASLPDANVRR